MQNARLPRMLFWMLVAVAAVQVWVYYPRATLNSILKQAGLKK